jgi:uncharacterized protein YjbI with pentapeptide repeats
MDTQELIDRYNRGETNFAKVDLHDQIFVNVNLHRINFKEANLKGTVMCYKEILKRQI